MSDALQTHLKDRRQRQNLSQSALAAQVGVSRQALIAIEVGRQVPSTSLALKLARALGCTVEDLFVLPTSPTVRAALAPRRGRPTVETARVVMGRVGASWIAHRIADDTHRAADGVIVNHRRGDKHATVEPLADLTTLASNVLVAGCAPLLGVLVEHAARRYPDAPMAWLPAASTHALSLLAADMVHVAGFHAVDDDDSRALLHKHLSGRALTIVNLTRWRQGFVVPKGNPQAIREAADLLRGGLRFARRERGSGADQLARQRLARAGAKRSALPEGPRATGHADVAQLVRSGAADVGIAIESVAVGAGLDFVPLSEERFDLVVPTALLSAGPAGRVVDLLHERWFRAEAAALPGYDGALSGQVIEHDVA